MPIVELNTPFAKQIGFTSDLFDGYLWIRRKTVIISLITSKYPGQGNFMKLVNNLQAAGYRVKVPTPSTRMRAILTCLGFKPKMEWSKTFKEHVDMMVKP